MHVRDLAVAVALDGAPDRVRFFGRDIAADEDMARLSRESPRPTQDDRSADETHERVRPHPTPLPGDQQRGDGEHGRNGVRQNVHVRRPHVVVVRQGLSLHSVVVHVFVRSSEQPRANQIHDKPDHGHDQRLVEPDGRRLD